MLKSLVGSQSLRSAFSKQLAARVPGVRYMSTDLAPVHILRSTTGDPFFNLALEEYVFLSGGCDRHTLYLWRNKATVVIGKHQNYLVETRYADMQKDDVILTRRRSGGGAVYQDLGNTNFTFVSPRDQYDKDRNTSIIIRALASFGIDASASGRNDILVGERKVSGSAYKLLPDRALHHGTLLRDVDMPSLGKYLNPDKKKLQSKGVSSVTARVQNLVELNNSISHESMCDAVISSFLKEYNSPAVEIQNVNPETLKDEALTISYNELKNWDWVQGKTPSFNTRVNTRFTWGIMDVHLESGRGRIDKIAINSDSLHPSMIDDIERTLTGCRLDASDISAALGSIRSTAEGDLHEYAYHVDEFASWFLNEMDLGDYAK